MVSPAQLAEINEAGETMRVGEEADDNRTENLEIMDYLDAGNIVEELPTDAGTTICTLFNDAKLSMAEWDEKYKKAIRLAKMEPKEKSKTFPFEGASTAMTPFVIEAMIDFNARSAPELAFSDNIVKAKVWGGQQLPEIPEPPQPDPNMEGGTPEEQQRMQALQQQAQQAFEQATAIQQEAQSRIDAEKEDRADRVAEYSNYQLRRLIPMWQKEQDKMLLSLPGVGTMYKETYQDFETGEVRSDLCYANEIIFDHECKTFEEAPDKFKEYPPMTRNEVIEKIRGAEKWDIDEADLSDDERETYDFIQACTWFDLDDDGLQEPYIVIVHKKDNKAVFARPMYDDDSITVNDDGEISKIEVVERYTQFQFIPDPEGGPMGLGWGILLGPTFEEINKLMRQMSDAGTLQIVASNSGLFASPKGAGARGNRAQRGPIELKMGKLTPVEVGGTGTLAQNVIQFPAAGPSQQTFALLEYMVMAAQNLTDASKQVEANPNEAAALYLARLQQTLKRPNVVTMRVYMAQAEELKKIRMLNFKYFSDEKYNRIIDRPRVYSMQRDFNPDDCDIQLVADPSQGSDIERIARAETVLQNAKTEQTPVTNVREATIQYYEVLGVKDTQTLVPPPQPDPMARMLEQQMQMESAREQFEAELKMNDQRLKEADQRLRQLDMQMKQQKAALDAAREMAELGIETDLKEADLAKKYAETLKLLVEAGYQDPMTTTMAIEDRFINNAEGGVPNGARVTTLPAGNPGADQFMGE